MERRENEIYRALARAIWLATGVAVALWFLDTIALVVLLFVFAFVLVLALNVPVTWLEERRVPRPFGTLLVSLAVVIALSLLGWLVLPRMAEQVVNLSHRLPRDIVSLSARLSELFKHYPIVQRWLQPNAEALTRTLPSMPTLLMHVGKITLTVFEILVFAIVVASTVVYTLARPRPLLKNYLAIMPPHLQERAERAFTRGSQMVVGWIYAHLMVGAIEAVCAGLFLTFLRVPGGFIWAAFTFFAELVPRIGPYLMAVPPLLEALAVSPIKALWVALFYTCLNETMGTFVLPFLWGKEMELHPVSLLFAVMALGGAFGILGALLAVPITGFVKAFYEEFYLLRQPKDEHREERAENILHREMEEMEHVEAPPG
ncbi:MAG TPA: AI-2E family transporter [Chthonomonadaceae bacterium]|nr:AI-2E family transporter [Chthonomonadaceae bacterium]